MYRILLAEDDKNFGLVLKMELEEEGYAVDLVGDGVEAVLKVIEDPHAYHMAIIDLTMPRLDGINALRIIGSLPGCPPAIAISGNAGTGEISRALDAGASHCLTKPFPLERIRAVIKSVLDMAGPAGA